MAQVGGGAPVYDHCAQKRNEGRPTCPPEASQTLAGFWEINRVWAHCLLDSRCEGIMVSSNYARTTGMWLIQLDQPIGLQLACIGSKSTITMAL